MMQNTAIQQKRPKGSPDRIRSWRRRARGCDAIELRVVGMDSHRVHARWTPEEAEDEDWPDEVFEACQEHADETGIYSIFELVSIVDGRDDLNYQIRRRPNGSDMESPSAEGVLSQTMRHMESVMRQSYQQQALFMQGFSSITATLQARVDRLEAERMEAIQLYFDGHRALAAAEAIGEMGEADAADPIDKLEEKVMRLLPIVLGESAKRNALETERVEAMKQLASKISSLQASTKSRPAPKGPAKSRPAPKGPAKASTKTTKTTKTTKATKTTKTTKATKATKATKTTKASTKATKTTKASTKATSQ